MTGQPWANPCTLVSGESALLEVGSGCGLLLAPVRASRFRAGTTKTSRAGVRAELLVGEIDLDGPARALELDCSR
jgi:hypothetical protein